MPRYPPHILEALATHGLVPRPDTPPRFLRDAVNDLYRHEIKRLRDRCRAGEFPVSALADEVRTLRKRYLLLSTPLALWTVEGPPPRQP